MRRRAAREIVVQSLYQLEMNEASTLMDAIQTVLDSADESDGNNPYFNMDVNYVTGILNGVIQRKDQIDQILTRYLKSWKVDRLSKVDHQILRLAVYEMLFVSDVPEKVAVNEAIELAKHFGTDESGKFVNGVLGKMLKEFEA
ncbi:transcription antitermination factor NusB [Marinicrinis lubricantis]|uniref:Transcription antitermination protein NusB n=1 Tax=Marinicrinis lubricantis TaxID=2086470 RepID=A0ABW1IRL0_9BACL